MIFSSKGVVNSEGELIFQIPCRGNEKEERKRQAREEEI